MDVTYFIEKFNSCSVMRSKVDVVVNIKYPDTKHGSEVAEVSVSSDLLHCIIEQHNNSEWLPLNRMPRGLFDTLFAPPNESALRYEKLKQGGFFDNDT